MAVWWVYKLPFTRDTHAKERNSPCTWGQHWATVWTRWPLTVFPNLNVPYISSAMKSRARERERVQMTVLFGSMLHLAYLWIPDAGTLSQASLHPFPGHFSILRCTSEEYFSSFLQHLRWTWATIYWVTFFNYYFLAEHYDKQVSTWCEWLQLCSWNYPRRQDYTDQETEVIEG